MILAKANPDNVIEIFRRALSKSEPVIFSTDTIYGIGAPISDKKANEKIFDIKGRDKSKPFPILISSYEQLADIAVIESDKQRELMETVWPGAVTLILKAKEGLDSLYTLNGNVAVRMPDKTYLKDLLNEIGAISATSANLSGIEYNNDLLNIINQFKKIVDFFIIDNNINISSSAIIDISKSQFKVIRHTENLPDIDIFSS